MKQLIFILLLSFASFSQYPVMDFIPTNGLVGYYPMEADAGDSSGNNNHGNIVGWLSPTNTGVTTIGDGFMFDGFSGYINCGDVDQFEGSDTVTFCIAISPMSIGGWPEQYYSHFLSKWSTSNDIANSSYRIYMDNDSLYAVFSDGISTDTAKVDLQTTEIPWLMYPYTYFLICSFNQGIVKFYTGAGQVFQDTLSVTTINNSTSDFIIGSWQNSLVTFEGFMDEALIYNRELSFCELHEVMTMGFYPPVVQWNWNNSELQTSNSQNYSYQWLDCNNNMNPIVGETNSTYTPGSNGSYAVEINYLDSCTYVSDCFLLDNLNIASIKKCKSKKLQSIVDLIGRPAKDKPNTLLIYIYSDGTTEKVFRTE